MAVWILDASHGGNDTGIVGNVLGRRESDIALEVILETKKHLERNGEKVILTRDRDINISWKRRIEIVNENQSNFFVSFHMNYHIDKSINGVQVLYGKDNYENKRLSKLIRDEILSDIKTNDNGIMIDRSGSLDKISAMSVLIYGDYLTNKNVELDFDSKEYGRIIAKACLAMVDKVLLTTPVIEPKKLQKMAWRVCIGYYKDYNEAIDIMVDMHKKGYKGTHVVPYNGK